LSVIGSPYRESRPHNKVNVSNPITPFIASPQVVPLPNARLDLLLVHPQQTERELLAAALTEQTHARVKALATPQEALGSYERARFDAVLAPIDLGLTAVWPLISMVRSGRIGFAHTPFILLCSDAEGTSFEALREPNLHLCAYHSIDDLLVTMAHALSPARKPRVLVIEDDVQQAKATARALEKYFAVTLAYNGTEGIALWSTHQHDLVVLDLNLPDQSGMSVQTEILRQKPQQAIVILTSSDSTNQHAQHLFGGASEFFSKSLDLSQLATACYDVLAKQRTLSSATRNVHTEAALEVMQRRVRAASYYLSCGKALEAQRQLQHALATRAGEPLSDDEWAELMSEFDQSDFKTC
jgi:two-component system, OmpR family, alkaline phosphatase synthesis response regulator PhoP